MVSACIDVIRLRPALKGEPVRLLVRSAVVIVVAVAIVVVASVEAAMLLLFGGCRLSKQSTGQPAAGSTVQLRWELFNEENIQIQDRIFIGLFVSRPAEDGSVLSLQSHATLSLRFSPRICRYVPLRERWIGSGWKRRYIEPTIFSTEQ